MSWDFDETVPREGTDCLKYDFRKEVFGVGDLIPMWVADMDFRTPVFIVEELRRRLDHEIFGYSVRPSAYFTSIISWLRDRHSWETEKDWIIFTPGIVPALNLCTLAFTEPGDGIIVQPPVYFPFFSAVENHGRRLIYNRLSEYEGRWSMDNDALIGSIDKDTKMIFISNPHNPVGRCWTRDELTSLAEICLERDILMISDEIHCDLVLPGNKHTPLASLSEEIARRTVTCIAPSKTFNLAGLSTSSVIISDPLLRDKFRKTLESLHIGNGNIFGTVASAAAYAKGHKWVDALTSYIAGNVSLVTKSLGNPGSLIKPVSPEATYMIWLDCRAMGMNGKELSDFFVREAAVGMNEGSAFGPGGEGFMRMNLGTTAAVVARAMVQIENALTRLKDKKDG
ncbi:MAG: PatB family C-S lyase [Bacteroidales bacterium]|jgi:cystathionine beta-lyase|nr:PatB family C-S lyase [Bacteroidales bacterium]